MSAVGSERSRLYYAQLGLCFYCGDEMLFTGSGGDFRNCTSPYRCTVDHITPLGRGGENNLLNKIACCRACNQHKGDRMPTEDELSRAREFQGLAMSRTRKTLKERMMRILDDDQPSQ